MGTFSRWAGGVLGVVFGGAVAVFGVGGGIKEALKANEPGESNVEQFTRGFGSGLVNAGKGFVDGITGSVESEDVTDVLEGVEGASREVLEGVEEFTRGRSLGPDGSEGDVC